MRRNARIHAVTAALPPTARGRMIGLIQRVSEASVRVDGALVAAIGPGLLALVAIEPEDGEVQSRRMAKRLFGYRVFADADGRMNRNLADSGGALLLVSQFTLAADTRSGMRPGFSTAASPAVGECEFNRLLQRCHARGAELGLGVESGRFGAHMTVALINDGPVTFHLRV